MPQDYRETMEPGIVGNEAKAQRIMLGLEIASRHARRGVGMSMDQIAAFCGVSHQAIFLIEKKAFAKLLKRAPELRAFLK